MGKKTGNPMQTFSMNNLFNQYSNGVVKYVGREFTEYEALPPLQPQKARDWSKITKDSLGGLPRRGKVDKMASQEDMLNQLFGNFPTSGNPSITNHYMGSNFVDSSNFSAQNIDKSAGLPHGVKEGYIVVYPPCPKALFGHASILLKYSKDDFKEINFGPYSASGWQLGKYFGSLLLLITGKANINARLPGIMVIREAVGTKEFLNRDKTVLYYYKLKFTEIGLNKLVDISNQIIRNEVYKLVNQLDSNTNPLSTEYFGVYQFHPGHPFQYYLPLTVSCIDFVIEILSRTIRFFNPVDSRLEWLSNQITLTSTGIEEALRMNKDYENFSGGFKIELDKENPIARAVEKPLSDNK